MMMRPWSSADFLVSCEKTFKLAENKQKEAEQRIILSVFRKEMHLLFFPSFFNMKLVESVLGHK